MADRELDVREIEGEPFGDIIGELETLEEPETMVLINSFEPVPLYDVLDRRGFTHDAEQVADDEWRVRIEHG